MRYQPHHSGASPTRQSSRTLNFIYPDPELALLRLLMVLTLILLGPTAAAAQAGAAKEGGVQVSDALQPGDVVRLRIWREPDLSGEFPVDEKGTIVFPKVGPVYVASVGPDSLKQLLVRSYSTYLRDPAIEVVLLRRVTIQGAVRNPGLYPVDMTMTVADAMALAGGAALDGRPDRVELRRGGEKLTIDLSANTKLGDTPLRSGDQLYFPQRSWISRNPGIVVGALTATAGILASVLLR